MKKVLAFVSVVLLCVGFSTSYASDRCNNRCGDTVVIEQVIKEIVNNRNTGALSASAGGHQFYLGSPALQWSAVAVYFDDTVASSFAIGKNVNNIFISGGFTIDDERDNGSLFFVQASGRF